MVPSAMPAMVAFGMFSVVAHWNDLYWPLIVISDRRARAAAARHAVLPQRGGGHDFGPLTAGAVIITAPLVIAFLLAQRRFIEGE